MNPFRVIYHHEPDDWWAESPDIDGWSAAGDSYAEVAKLAREGIPFALGHDADLEHYVPAGERVPAWEGRRSSVTEPVSRLDAVTEGVPLAR